ncbi:MAG: RAD55 family ATPase [Pyrinomonadaceae bacterium]
MTVDKIPTGCPGLDDVLFGGIPGNTITVIMGAPGTGKTILAQQFAFANATRQTPALYLTTLSEPLEKFIAHGQMTIAWTLSICCNVCLRWTERSSTRPEVARKRSRLWNAKRLM